MHPESMSSRYSYEREEPNPRGGWFEPDNTVGRRRIARAFRILAILAGLAVGLVVLWFVMDPRSGPSEPAMAALLALLAPLGGGLVYVIADSIGHALTSVAWRALGHDLRLRSVWAILLEIALFLSAAGMLGYSILDAAKTGSIYSGLVALLLFCLSFWPFLRHRIKYGRWPEQR